jgi:hypothetical protein
MKAFALAAIMLAAAGVVGAAPANLEDAPVPVVFDDTPATCADGGTCCNEFGSTCYPNNCSEPSCSESNKYWRTDGKPCRDPE